MPSKRHLFFFLVLISSISCIVRSRSGSSRGGSGGGGGGTGWCPQAQLYLNKSTVATRSETDLQTCLLTAMKNGADLASSITCKDISYSFNTISPCSNPQYSSNDCSSPQAMVCGSNSSSVCYQTTSETFVAAFAEYTSILKPVLYSQYKIKPYATTWKCTGKDEFCCGFECCTAKKSPAKWIWIVVILVVFLLILPTIIIAIYCIKKKSTTGSNASGQNNVQHFASYNARAY